ncbi:hypothetical protein CP533_3572 [Ophiocordyceps camponoti-saundersi (nom. inval.)]|nr:hypothetical protein CP533_3572 [Ophiocordyceps camponoti-saundersi (nom. inval.)]
MRLSFSALALAAASIHAAAAAEENKTAGEVSKGAKVRTFDTSVLGVDKVKQFSGYIDNEEEDKHTFFWFFESRGDPAKDPVTLWVEGGPACSSMLGLLQQVGPARINEKLQPEFNPFSWINRTSMIFLDQPANTGFSHTSKHVNTSIDAAKDVLTAMTTFLKQFPEYAKQDFYVSGTSYSGHFVPAIAAEILSKPESDINLKGAIIGNGLTDPKVQFPAFRPMGCGEGGIPAVFNESACAALEAAEPVCKELLQECSEKEESETCLNAFGQCFAKPLSLKPGLNVYDLRKPCLGNSSNFCTDNVEPIVEWLNLAEVQKALGVEVVEKWETCNSTTGADVQRTGDGAKSLQKQVVQLLEKKIPVLVFAGDGDYICNWLGNRDWTNALEWSGREAFNKAETKALSVASDGKEKEYGNIKSADGLSFVRIFDAGHFAIRDQSEGTLDLVDRFMKGELKGN